MSNQVYSMNVPGSEVYAEGTAADVSASANPSKSVAWSGASSHSRLEVQASADAGGPWGRVVVLTGASGTKDFTSNLDFLRLRRLAGSGGTVDVSGSDDTADITAAQADATQALADSAAAQADATQALADAATADGKAVVADGKAVTAQAKADGANRKTWTFAKTGRNGAGAWSLGAYLQVGDRVDSVVRSDTGADISADFESAVTVAGQVQQSSATDYSAVDLGLTTSRVV